MSDPPSQPTTAPVRAEHVGSLLRPPGLLHARDALARGALSAAAFKRVEDDAVGEVVARQAATGVGVLTDGELRRDSFQSQFAAAVDGFTGVSMAAWLHGDWHSDAHGDRSVARPDDLAVVAPLRLRRSLSAEEATFLRTRTDQPTKITLPSPSLMANLWHPGRSRDAYPALDDYLADVTQILVDEVRELARLGVTRIQIDAPHYPLLIEPRWRDYYEARGWPADRWLAYGVDLDNAVIAAAPGVAFGFHLCRGNQGSRWLVSGGYEPIARAVFGRIQAGRLLLEYDDERSGAFDPLQLVRPDTTVVLGLVTTKSGRAETVDDLRRRIHDAARHVPLHRLAVGTQCGFATSVVGNAVTQAEQWRKLELLAETAAAVWG